jgi:hypothetical protein
MGGMRNRKRSFLLLAIVLSFASAGCTYVPTAELKVFRESVVAANTAATPVLDELSSTERKVKNDIVAREKGRPTFNPADAAYFSDIGDAPATTVFRRGYKVLDRLSEVLVGLATGAGTASDVANVEGLASEAADLVAILSSASLAAAPAAGVITPAFAVVKPALEEVSNELSRLQARQVIEAVQARKLVEKLTDALIAATPAMFPLLIRDADRRANSTSATDDAAAAYVERVAKVRVLLANYVVLLREVNSAWNEAVRALESKSTANVTVLTERVSELRAAAIATRRAYVEMNVGR